MVHEPKPIALSGNFNREWFLQQVKDCEDKIKQQTDKIDALKRIYLRENTEFETGEKVEIVTILKSFTDYGNGEKTEHERRKVRYAYIYGVTIGKRGQIIYKLHRASVNGHKTTQRDYLGKNETIQKLGTNE